LLGAESRRASVGSSADSLASPAMPEARSSPRTVSGDLHHGHTEHTGTQPEGLQPSAFGASVVKSWFASVASPCCRIERTRSARRCEFYAESRANPGPPGALTADP
jgi:hypothetical protein